MSPNDPTISRDETEKNCSSLPDTGSRVVNTAEQSAVSELRADSLERQGVAGVGRVPLDGVLVVVQGLPPGQGQQGGQPDLQYSSQSEFQ